jgi:hypothetical protein
MRPITHYIPGPGFLIDWSMPLSLLDRTHRLLVYLTQRDEVRPALAPDLKHLHEPGAVSPLLDAATRHQVHGLAFNTLTRIGPSSGLPEAVLAEIVQPLATMKKQAVFWEFEQERVLAGLLGKGFQPLVLKGGALRHVAYASPVERLMGDLDILTTRDHAPRYLEALRALGYESQYSDKAREGFWEHHFHERVEHAGGFLVEVHWGLTRPGALCSLDHRWFLDRARKTETRSGTPLLVPSFEDMLLHLVSQIEEDGFRNLRRIVDLDRTVSASRELDWIYIRDRARDSNLGAVLSVSLRLANLLLQTSAPRDLLEGRGLGGAARRAIELMSPVPHLLNAPGRAEVAADDLFWLWCLPLWSLRFRALRELVAGMQDPLNWVWLGKEVSDNVDTGWQGGLSRVVKLGALQGWLGVRGLTRKVKFW